MQQIAKTLEVVQDVLVTVCTVQNKEEKAGKIKDCVERIKQNKAQVAQAYKSQLEGNVNEEEFPPLSKVEHSQSKKKDNEAIPMEIIGFDQYLQESCKYLISL